MKVRVAWESLAAFRASGIQSSAVEPFRDNVHRPLRFPLTGRKQMTPAILLLSVAASVLGSGAPTPAAVSQADPLNSALQEVHDLCAERTRLWIHHRKGHPRFAEIERRITEIHGGALREFETVATDAALECSEEPLYGQPAYGVILHATSCDEIAADELLLFHADRIYRTRGAFRKLATTGEGWYFRTSVDVPKESRFVIACIQDAPEEVENVKNGFMPNSDRARDPDRPYRTEIFGRDGKPLRSFP